MTLSKLIERVSELTPIANNLAEQRKVLAEENWQLCDRPGAPYNKKLEDEMAAKMWAKEVEHVAVVHDIRILNIWISKHVVTRPQKIEAITPKS